MGIYTREHVLRGFMSHYRMAWAGANLSETLDVLLVMLMGQIISCHLVLWSRVLSLRLVLFGLCLTCSFTAHLKRK